MSFNTWKINSRWKSDLDIYFKKKYNFQNKKKYGKGNWKLFSDDRADEFLCDKSATESVS